MGPFHQVEGLLFHGGCGGASLSIAHGPHFAGAPVQLRDNTKYQVWKVWASVFLI